MATIAAIDPGTKVCGIAIWDSETKEILCSRVLESKDKNYIIRTREIVREAAMLLRLTVVDLLYVEQFAMQGHSGEMLHKFIGAMFYAADPIPTTEVRNTTLKKFVGNHGHADKEEVALGVLNYFAAEERSSLIIEDLIDKKMWDVTDAFAIGICGYEQAAK